MSTKYFIFDIQKDFWEQTLQKYTYFNKGGMPPQAEGTFYECHLENVNYLERMVWALTELRLPFNLRYREFEPETVTESSDVSYDFRSIIQFYRFKSVGDPEIRWEEFNLETSHRAFTQEEESQARAAILREVVRPILGGL